MNSSMQAGAISTTGPTTASQASTCDAQPLQLMPHLSHTHGDYDVSSLSSSTNSQPEPVLRMDATTSPFSTNSLPAEAAPPNEATTSLPTPPARPPLSQRSPDCPLCQATDGRRPPPSSDRPARPPVPPSTPENPTCAHGRALGPPKTTSVGAEFERRYRERQANRGVREYCSDCGYCLTVCCMLPFLPCILISRQPKQK